MKIPKYWAKSVQSVSAPGGRTFRLSCWQWSDVSVEHAQQKADVRATELAQKVRLSSPLGRYAYGERPLREEITRAVTNHAGKEIAVVTRNAYGALILNAANAMFIDIDFDGKDTGATLTARLRRVFGVNAPRQEEPYCQRISAWARRHPDLSLRVYRTFAGLRCLITNQVFDPNGAETVDVLRALNSDPLYIRLCQAQACFRARLTPKPWRCRVDKPPSRYPWDNHAAEARYRQWEQRYERAILSYTVCRPLEQIGTNEIHPDIEPVLMLHDKLTCSEYDRKLA